MKLGTIGMSLALFLASGGVPVPRIAAAPLAGSPGGGNSIAWVKDLPTAQSLARARHKLVLQFLMLGDLPDPHC